MVEPRLSFALPFWAKTLPSRARPSSLYLNFAFVTPPVSVSLRVAASKTLMPSFEYSYQTVAFLVQTASASAVISHDLSMKPYIGDTVLPLPTSIFGIWYVKMDFFMLTLSPLIAMSEYETFISVSTFIIEPSCGMATQMLILKSLVSLVSVTFAPVALTTHE